MAKIKKLRTCFKGQIISEFLVSKKQTNKVIIFCSGMPGYPGGNFMEFFSKKGYWVFQPRYRGSWESQGKLFEKSPHLDITDVMDGIEKGFIDFWNNKKYKIKNPEFYLIGGSFGGPAVILNSNDRRVKKIIALSPVIDWKAQKDTVEPIDFLSKYVKNAFGNGYRIAKDGWNKTKTGNFYNPINEIDNVQGEKIWIIHSKDDDVVSYKPSEEFAEKTLCKLTLLKKGGHNVGKIITSPLFYLKVRRFLNSKI